MEGTEMDTPANPLPPDIVEGDSGDTDVNDDNDTPPGFDSEMNYVGTSDGD